MAVLEVLVSIKWFITVCITDDDFIFDMKTVLAAIKLEEIYFSARAPLRYSYERQVLPTI